MFCPRCGQEQVNDETRFCSRCGFLMTGVGEVVANDGLIPEKYSRNRDGKNSPRKRGVKQGAMVMLVGTFLFVPLFAILSAEFDLSPAVVAITAVLSFVGGLLRIIYALMFESSVPGENTLEENMSATVQNALNKPKSVKALPPEHSVPASAYAPPAAGNWRDTNDLEPSSVTENTTKLLEEERK